MASCYELAVQNSELLKNQKELIDQAEARARAALGGILPDVRWIATDLIQDTSGVGGESGGVSGTLTRRERIEHRVHLDQPLFSGFREFSAIKGYKRESARDELLYKRAMINLFNDVSEAFYSVISAETNLGNTRTSLTLAEDRVKELKERARLGKARESEVISAEAQVALLKSEEVVSQSDIAIYREILSFLIGTDISRRPLGDPLQEVILVPSLEQALLKAEERSDILAQREEVAAKRFEVRYEKGFYWPSLGLSGNYYTRRVGFQDGIDWDALFTLDVPLYQGGSVKARVREVSSELSQAENTLDRLVRDVRSQVKRAYVALLSSQGEAEALKTAYRTAKRSYELQVKEYRLGLVNNLDVLQALNIMQENKKSLDNALIRQKLNHLRLKHTIEENL